jgi:hypothetical protein
MNSTVKAPGYKRLRQEHQNVLSNFAFNFNLRRYNVVFGYIARDLYGNAHQDSSEPDKIQVDLR